MTMDDIQDTSTATVDTSTASTSTVDTSTPIENSSPSSAPAASDAPKSMAEAMFPTPAPAEVAKPVDAAAPAEVTQAEVGPDGKPVVKEEQKPADPEDLTKMPEGLAPKAQERFQKLANENKEVKAELENMRSQIQPFYESLTANKVTGEQFTMATTYIGLVNKGDLRGALELMDRERAQLALYLGEPVAGVDALQEFPDLRQAVDQFQIDERHALELAKQRKTTAVTQQRQQQQQEQQMQRQQQEEAWNAGVLDIDNWSKDMAAKDLDYPHVEKLLLQRIERITQTQPPKQWRQAVQDAYDLIKAGAGTIRAAAPAAAPVLRPTGAGSPATKPKTMAEAMWGNNL